MHPIGSKAESETEEDSMTDEMADEGEEFDPERRPQPLVVSKRVHRRHNRLKHAKKDRREQILERVDKVKEDEINELDKFPLLISSANDNLYVGQRQRILRRI